MVYAYVIGQASVTVRVKLGRAEDPEHRVKQLQTGNPELLEVFATTTAISEAELHTRYAEYRFRGEWFDLPLGVYTQLIRDCVAGPPEAPEAAVDTVANCTDNHEALDTLEEQIDAVLTEKDLRTICEFVEVTHTVATTKRGLIDLLMDNDNGALIMSDLVLISGIPCLAPVGSPGDSFIRQFVSTGQTVPSGITAILDGDLAELVKSLEQVGLGQCHKRLGSKQVGRLQN